MNKKKTLLGLAIGVAVLALLVPGFVPGLSAAPAAPASAPTTNSPLYVGANANSASGFVLTTEIPRWNSGNLCTVEVTGSVRDCRNSPSVQCDLGAQYYNFYGNDLTINIRIDGHNQCALVNIRGYNDTINLRVTGSFDSSSNPGPGAQTNGFVAMAIYGERDVLNALYSGSHINSTFFFYQDHNTFNFDSSGSSLTTQAYFVGAFGRFATGLCPYKNASRSDVANLWTTGSNNSAVLTWVNAVGYTTALAYGPYPGHGHANSLGTENYSGFFACGWLAPGLISNADRSPPGAGVFAAVTRP